MCLGFNFENLPNIKIPNIETLTVSFQNTTLKYSEHTYLHINVHVYRERGRERDREGAHLSREWFSKFHFVKCFPFVNFGKRVIN